MSQSLKQQVAADALARIVPTLRADTILGIGTGSTANCFIDALGAARLPLKGAVASSEASAARLASWQIPVFDLNAVEQLAYYVDGADEATEQLALVKGGGGALTREKIVAEASAQFICIVDHSKLVPALGRFPLPVEVVPMARAQVARRLVQLGGRPVWRDGFVTDNGGVILDVHDLRIAHPAELEAEINQIPGVITNGLFARRPADLLLAAGPTGITAYQRSRT